MSADDDPTMLTKAGITARMGVHGSMAARIKRTFLTVEQLLAAIEGEEPLTEREGIGPSTADAIGEWYDRRKEIEREVDAATVTSLSRRSATITNNGDWSDALGIDLEGAA